jgi:hypothetical protein
VGPIRGRLTCLLADGEPLGYRAALGAESGIGHGIHARLDAQAAADLAFDLVCEALRRRRITAASESAGSGDRRQCRG